LSQSYKQTPGKPQSITNPRRSDAARETGVAAWEMIAAGRYMPRRIRGSFPGRELG